MNIDINKQYQTRDGRPVRIISTDGLQDCPIVVIVDQTIHSYTIDGKLHSNFTKYGSELDLIEVPKKFRYERWVNVYNLEKLDDQLSDLYISREEADHYADPSRIACVKVIIEGVEGEGL